MMIYKAAEPLASEVLKTTTPPSRLTLTKSNPGFESR